MNALLIVPADVIVKTIGHLQTAGQRRAECVVLWLGRRCNGTVHIVEAYRPQQQAASDMFRIPPVAMRTLLTYLGDNNLFIGALVHSHPMEAFHSRADDVWAIIRHAGALSIVLPYFATKATVSNFLTRSAIFTLTPSNQWEQLTPPQFAQRIVVQ